MAGHITAGDLSPISIQTETIYGTASGTDVLYADVRPDGGKFTPKDTPNPYLAWRYGSRSYDPADYVTRQNDAGFDDSVEVRDIDGWERIIEGATGTGGTAAYGSLPSRQASIYVRTDPSEWQGRIYHGCKTDTLTVSCDAPGGIVAFDETVLASYGEDSDISTPKAVWTVSDAPAVQWMNGVSVGGVSLYPQSFKLTVSNAIERKRGFVDGQAVTVALLEGRRNIEFEMDLWMEDLDYMRGAIHNGTVGNIVLTLGIDNPVEITLSGVSWMADGTNPDLIQDKQRETLRFRAASVALTDPEAVVIEPEE